MIRDFICWSPPVRPNSHGPSGSCECFWLKKSLSAEIFSLQAGRAHRGGNHLLCIHLWSSIIPFNPKLPYFATHYMYSEGTCWGTASECQCENKQNRIRLTSWVKFYVTKSTLNNIRSPLLKDISWGLFSAEVNDGELTSIRFGSQLFPGFSAEEQKL